MRRLGLPILALAAMAPGLAAQTRGAADTLVVGCTGGRRGHGSGVAVTGDGAVLAWAYMGWAAPGEGYRPLRHDPHGAAAAFVAAADVESRRTARHFPDAEICFLRWRAGTASRNVDWPPGEPPPQVVPLLDTLANLTGADPRSSWLRRDSRRTP